MKLVQVAVKLAAMRLSKAVSLRYHIGLHAWRAAMTHARLVPVLTLLLAALPAFGQDDPQAVIVELRARIAELERENAALRERLGVAEQQAQTLVREREDLTAEREQLEKLAGVTAKGEQVASAIALVDSRYLTEGDAAGTTRVTFKPRRIETTGAGPFSVEHYLGVAYAFVGETMQEPPATVDLNIYTFSHPATAYASVREAEVIVDGEEAFTIPLASYEVLKARKSPAALKRRDVRRDERLTFTLDADVLRRLATAQRVLVKLPGNELQLSREHVAMLAGARQRISQGI